MKKKNLIRESGQIVLMVLLASALVLTVGMSISKKTVIETRIDSDEELLKQAFNTAESGVEYYLATGKTDYGLGGGSAEVSTSTIGEVDNLNSGGTVLGGSPFLFWLVGHDGSDGIDFNNKFTGTINSIRVDDDFDGALKIDLFECSSLDCDLVSDYSVNRSGENIRVNTVNEFIFNGSSDTSSIPVSGGMLLSVTPIGGNTSLTVSGSAIFPSQGEEITSVGEMEGGVNTKIKVENRFEVPLFMLEAISSGGDISN